MPKKKVKISKIGYVAGGLLILAVVLMSQVWLDIPVEILVEEYTNEHSRFMDIDDLDVHFRDEGEGEPLVLLHGWSASLHTWDGWVEELKDDFRIIRMDLPAFGLTGPTPEADYSIDFYVNFLDRFLTELGIDHCYLAGNSLGGAITWSYASEYPDKVNKIILLNAAGYRMERPGIIRLARPSFIQGLIRYITPDYAIRALVKQVYGDEDKVTDEVVTRYHRLLLREGNRGAIFKVLNFADERDPAEQREAIKSIGVPSLIMWGELDSWIPVDHAYKFDNDIPGSTLVIYEGAGHIPMEEIPGETALDARLFLLETHGSED